MLIVFFLSIAITLPPASAQSPKHLRTKKGISVALVNLLHAKPDCSSGVAPVTVPIVQKKPTGGTVEMTILVANVAANGTCPARRVPVITLIYTPMPDFIGTDSVTIDVEMGNRSTIFNYSIDVLASKDTL
jgi:hypothetical protein